ncbi:unnamed protein product [Allacma fusca]|uniref:[histone H3]-trimethyl-L-lysine(4) demethylase n=1 Tax=Allacma fusca TaxID=39272 RepID=A0A8J2K0K2_9HEXA|nr:unnamed protein product [Allacma fusca]
MGKVKPFLEGSTFGLDISIKSEMESEERLESEILKDFSLNEKPDVINGIGEGIKLEVHPSEPAAPKKNVKSADVFTFIRPLEAPVFCPTVEEFQDPLVYINKIRPIAEKAGICKIRPPNNWQPPFAVDVDNFKFTPRVQRLNELEAKTRIKLNFLDQIAKFWELQGSSLKIPMIDKKALDLYSLHKLVQNEGGKEKLNTDKKWNRIATRIGYHTSKQYGPLLRSYYDKILYPFDVFHKSKDKLKSAPANGNDSPVNSPIKSTPTKNSPSKGRMAGKMRIEEKEDDVNQEVSTGKAGKKRKPSAELRRLLFYGAGPKMEGYNKQVERHSETYGKVQLNANDPLAKYVCQVCRKGDGDDWMLLCDGCDDSYHTYCLSPPLAEVPKGDWRCPQCVAEEVSKPTEAFGFEQAQREYTLQQFGEMADQFKSDYFNMPVHRVPSELVEKEFWRIVSSIDEDVTVEYGADLHTMDHGSGFPTDKSKNILAGDELYIHSSWNLNNLPVLSSSVLGHIHADISGMKVPWMYVGMCFATFCWHNEDHWSYSINYLHWGEPKTWYGVPGSQADKFEDAMKLAAPELFQSQPDLLHQLVTIMNPNILMQSGVSVYRMDQKAGEFIVTFPRAYHAGFNQGYNFAEAVNFAPADWLAIGRECITHYSNLHRYCVFSHDELVCKMSGEPDQLDLVLAMAAYKDMVTMFESEKVLRRDVLEWGIKTAERIPFELLPDDERLCDFCKTTCFLSAITCSCTRDRLVCLRHYDKLCECPPSSHLLKFRFTLDELPVTLQKLHKRTVQYEKWISTLTTALTESDHPKKDSAKLTLEELRKLMQEAEAKKYPKTALWDTANAVFMDAEKCSQVAQSLVAGHIRTRKSESKFKLKIRDLEVFAEQLQTLPVKLEELDMFDNLLESIRRFQEEVADLISQECPNKDDLKICLNRGLTMDVELPEIRELEMVLNRRKWMELVDAADDAEGLWTVDYLDKTIEAGLQLRKDPIVQDRVTQLQNLRTELTNWETCAKKLLSSKPPVHTVMDLDVLVKEARKINIALPSLPALRDVSKKVREWSDKVKKHESSSEYPYLDVLEELVRKGSVFPVRLRQLQIITNQVENARHWLNKCSKVFLKKNTTIHLAQALLPRKELSFIPTKGEKVGWKTDTSGSEIAKLLQISDLADVKKSSILTKAFNEARTKEIELMKALRRENLAKKKNEIAEPLYCICQKRNDDFMVQCDLCCDWFHATCVPLPKIFDLGDEDGITSLAVVCEKISEGMVKYLCPCCCRSRRPKLETILELLESLQELPVKIFEGEVLTLLADRAMKWLDESRKLLSQPVMEDAFYKIEKESSIEPKPGYMKELVDVIGSPVKTPKKLSGCNNDSNQLDPTSPEKNGRSSGESSYNNHKHDENNVPQYAPPVIQLSQEALSELENILIEGNLMEISFEEILKLWKIYQSAQPKNLSIPDLRTIKYRIKKEIEGKESLSLKARKTRNGPSATSGSTNTENSPRKRTSIQGKRKSVENNGNGSSPIKKSAKVQEYDEDCAAENCRQPSGKEVNWVQCESECFKWFHLVCVGLKKSEVKKLESYQCKQCTQKRDDENETEILEDDAVTIKQEQ